MKKKYKLIALIGESGSGKDTIKQRLADKNPKTFHSIIDYTTRPQREGEKNGKDYHFISGEEFGEKVLNNEMIVAACFNDWFYGTGFNSFDKDLINIGCFSPEAIETLKLYIKDIEMKVFWIYSTPKTRLIRSLNREDNPDIDEIFRRYRADLVDFSDIDFNFKKLNNELPNDVESIIDVIEKECLNWLK